jgi:hypothetical protein
VAHGTISKTVHILVHKAILFFILLFLCAILNKYKKIEIISCILSDNGIKLEIINKRSYRKYPNIWRLKNSLLNDQKVIEEIRGKILKILELNENKDTIYQNLWDTAKASVKRKL